MTDLKDIPLVTIDGEQTSLGDYAGKVLLIVNVASKCGLTPQYEALQQLYERYGGRDFAVLGFPANNFGGQEPGTNEEIATFCSTTYDVSFPIFSKISVAGEDKHPFYAELIRSAPSAQPDGGAAMREKLSGFGLAPNPAPEITWNFEKFLVGRNGEVAARFAPNVAPDDAIVIQAIEAAL
ncbi:MAG TPA: glutathione peroxidase [Rhizorhapis sp.]